MERRDARDDETREQDLDRDLARDLARVASRADELTPEEQRAGSDDPEAQAAEILDESDQRIAHRSSPGDQPVERRRSEDTVDLTDGVTDGVTGERQH